MQISQYSTNTPLPEQTYDSDLEFWEPDRLYIEWLTFLYTIWRRIDYL